MNKHSFNFFYTYLQIKVAKLQQKEDPSKFSWFET